MEWITKDRGSRAMNTIMVNAIKSGRYNIYASKAFMDMTASASKVAVGYGESAIFIKPSDGGYALIEQKGGRRYTITFPGKAIPYDISGEYEYAGKSNGVLKFSKKGITFITKGARDVQS